jgi:hypothetical protein
MDSLKSLGLAPQTSRISLVARRTIVNADIRVAFSRERVRSCDAHFLSAPTCGQFSAAGALTIVQNQTCGYLIGTENPLAHIGRMK